MQNIGHHGTPSAIVEDVVVSESHQSQTVGGICMKFAMELAQTSRLLQTSAFIKSEATTRTRFL
jgi:hypothetical protein